VGFAVEGALAALSRSFSSFSLLRFSSRSRLFLSSNCFITAFNFLPSPSSTTLTSSPSAEPTGTLSPKPLPVPSLRPFSCVAHFFACSCVSYLMYTIPKVAPFSLSICGSNETTVPCAPKWRRICSLGVNGFRLVMSTAVGGGGPVEFASY
jgi:hypothetical protein